MEFLEYEGVGSRGSRDRGSLGCEVPGIWGLKGMESRHMVSWVWGNLEKAEGAESRGHGDPECGGSGARRRLDTWVKGTWRLGRAARAQGLWEDTRPPRRGGLQTCSARVHVCRGRPCHTPVPALAGPSLADATSWPPWVARAGA